MAAVYSSSCGRAIASRRRWRPPGQAGEVVVRIMDCGVVHRSSGDFERARTSFPLIPGHEPVGLGQNWARLRSVQEGGPNVAPPVHAFFSCGALRGVPPRWESKSIGPGLNSVGWGSRAGGYAEYMVVQPDHIVPAAGTTLGYADGTRRCCPVRA